MFYKTNYISTLGKIILGSDGEHLIGLWFEGQKYFANTVDGEMKTRDNLLVFADAKNWLDRYFRGEKPLIDELSVAPKGTEFRQAVWQILCEIPYGQVITYKDIAKRIAKQRGIENMSAQAIGGAVGHNPISIIIPCHRVIGVNGNLTGYAGGLEIKTRLLEHEQVDTSLFIPKV